MKPFASDSTWHARAAEDVLSALDAKRAGLTAAETEDRLRAYGPNRLPEAKVRHLVAKFLHLYHNVLIYVLLVAAGVTALLVEAEKAISRKWVRRRGIGIPASA